MSNCGADTTANEFLTSLLGDKSFDIPEIDFSGEEFKIPDIDNVALTAITLDTLVVDDVNGDAAFNRIMSAFAAHLRVEFDKGRITGADYTKAYISLVQAAISSASQFVLTKDAAYFQAVAAQTAAIAARVEMETAKVKAISVQIEALNQEAGYALTKMKVATEGETFCAAKFTVDELMPKQLELVKEQVETQRSQTLDERTDGEAISGSVGKQRDLYAQQIISYKQDSKIKGAKPFVDAWITMKTIDEGLEPPDGFTNVSLDEVLTVLKTEIIVV